MIGNIKKVIALKNIPFSNSPAEAKNKTFKSYYANDKTIENTKQLQDTIIYFITDFNDIRPTQALNGYTPTEVYSNLKPEFDFIALRQQDAIKRKETHKNSSCKAYELVLR